MINLPVERCIIRKNELLNLWEFLILIDDKFIEQYYHIDNGNYMELMAKDIEPIIVNNFDLKEISWEIDEREYLIIKTVNDDEAMKIKLFFS